MEENCKTFEEIASGAADCLRKKRSRADNTIRHYNVLWRKVKRYMEFNEIEHFESNVGKDYLLQEYGNCDYSKLSKHDKDIVRGVNVLCEFQETGSLLPVKEQSVFDGPVGQLMTRYLSYQMSLRLKKHTIDEKEQHLYRFLCFLNGRGITSVNTINQLHVLYFIKGIDPRFSALPHLTMRTLRGFFSYLYDQSMLDVDLSRLIPKDKYHKQAKLPSVYSPKEIEAMLTSIDRGNANGKRNYAIIMLAARLGLRASDIANLRFENLQWERCAIRFNQYKTGKELELPMLPEVGNAIVDYLRYGRPKSEESLVFLLSRSPYTPIHSGAITGIVHSSLVQGGISIDNRKHGTHVLRHSLASILLEKGTILPIISEVLGHKNTESTKYYLRIDLNSLRKCAIEVPPVASSFYGQKGGAFYE